MMKRHKRIKTEHFIIAILLLQVVIDFIMIWRLDSEVANVAYEWLSVYHKYIWNWLLVLFILHLVASDRE